jgi:hypothetical protein
MPVCAADVQEFKLQLILERSYELAFQNGNRNKLVIIEQAIEPSAPIEAVK